MQAALGFFQTGPAPGSRVFANLYRPCAVGAANAGIVKVMKGVERHIVKSDVAPHSRRVPISNRIYFDEMKLHVPFDLARSSSDGSLVAADAGHPGSKLGELLSERFYFSEVAATVGIAAPERRLLQSFLISWCERRLEPFHLYAITLFNRLDERISFGEQEASIESKDTEVYLQARGNINEHESFGTKGRCNFHLGVEVSDSPTQQILWTPVLCRLRDFCLGPLSWP